MILCPGADITSPALTAAIPTEDEVVDTRLVLGVPAIPEVVETRLGLGVPPGCSDEGVDLIEALSVCRGSGTRRCVCVR